MDTIALHVLLILYSPKPFDKFISCGRSLIKHLLGQGLPLWIKHVVDVIGIIKDVQGFIGQRAYFCT